MPDYLYSDGRHRQTVTHRMLYTTAVLCLACGVAMHRVPQMVRVNWGMVPPSKGGMSPAVADLVKNADRRRDEVDEKWSKVKQQ